MYEVCYSIAREQRQRSHQQLLQQQQQQQQLLLQHAMPATESVAQPAPISGAGCIRFPWRIAYQQLKEMKEKAPQLLAFVAESSAAVGHV